MSSILPQIELLQDVPHTHEQYAIGLMRLVINNLLEMDEVGIGTYTHGKEYGSAVAFDDGEFEHARLELRYNGKEHRFELLVTDNSEDFNTSEFRYRIIQDTPLYAMIPDGLGAAMVETAFEGQPTTFKSKKPMKQKKKSRIK